MRMVCLRLMILFAAVVVRSAAADLGRYQVILDKHLLGAPRPTAPTVSRTPPPQPAPVWSQQYRMTMITEDEATGTVRIGLQNLQDQTALLLIEGRGEVEGFQLESADFDTRTALVSYRGATHRFDLQEGAPQGSAPPTAPRSEVRSGSERDRRLFRTLRERGPENLRGEAGSGTPTVQIRRFASSEELQEHLKQQQMDAIRSGKPPLPIPLTPEMDAQLVKEGVLPPRENP